MRVRLLTVLTALFCLGFVTGHWLGGMTLFVPEGTAANLSTNQGESQRPTPVTSTLDRPSPFDRVSEGQIKVYADRVVLEVPNAQWSTFLDTNSMDPVLDEGANAIQVVPQSTGDVHVGDIVSYASSIGTVIHRVIETGTDENGWYAIVQGDNNAFPDGKVRFDEIQRVVVAIVY